MHVDPGLDTKIENYLADMGIEPVVDGLDNATIENPRSLLLDKKLEQFPHSEENTPSGSIMWAPPCQNWNPWMFVFFNFKLFCSYFRASNIDNQPIAFWPLERISDDLLMKEKYKQIPTQIVKTRESLPVFNV